MQPTVCFTAYNENNKAVCIENRLHHRIFIPAHRLINAVIPSLHKECIKERAWRCYHTDLSHEAVISKEGLHAHKTKVPYLYIFQDEETQKLCYSYDGVSVLALTDAPIFDVELYFSGDAVRAVSPHKLSKPFSPPLENRCTLL